MTTDNRTVPTNTGVQIMTLADLNPFTGKRIAILGDSGSGKTFLAATFPNPFFIDTDYNISTLKQESFKKYSPKTDANKIMAVQIKDPIDPKTGLFTKAAGFWQVLEAVNLANEDPNVGTIVFDTITSLSVLAMHVGLELTKADKRSSTLTEAGQHKVPLLTQADFGAEMSVMEQFFDQLPEINKIIICNCHIRIEKTPTGGITGYYPLITGDKHRQRFGSWFNEVWWYEVRGAGPLKKRILMTQTDSVRKGLKTTMDLPAEIEDPTYEKIMSYVKKG